jgi:hypothetical protein
MLTTLRIQSDFESIDGNGCFVTIWFEDWSLFQGKFPPNPQTIKVDSAFKKLKISVTGNTLRDGPTKQDLSIDITNKPAWRVMIDREGHLDASPL